MKLRNFIKSLGLLALFFGPTAYSAAFECVVPAGRILFYEDGSVNIFHNGRQNYTFICNLNEEWKGISQQTCAVWSASLSTAYKNGNHVRFYYNEDGMSSCSELPIYGNAPPPVYVGVENY